MNILALESSTATASWAWINNGTCRAAETTTGRASSALAASLAAFLNSPPSPPDRILVGVGPGSFSGIRAAIALAQGLARAWRCPVEPVRSSHAVAHDLQEVTFLGVFADAKRGQLFFTAYAHGVMTRPSCLIPTSAMEDHLSKCTRAISCGPLAGVPDCHTPTAASLTRARLRLGPEPDLALEPIYLHAPVTTPSS